MAINYEDERLAQVEQERQDALDKATATYTGMMEKSQQLYQEQIDATKAWEEQQKELQQKQTDFAIDQTQKQKQEAEKAYQKEQSAAYADYQKEKNAYGVNAEQMAAAGLAGSGYSESARVSMYNTYQARVTAARDSITQAVADFDAAMQAAVLQNDVAMAEIAFQALQQRMTLSLEGFQYENQLIFALEEEKKAIDSTYDSKWEDVLAQLLAEEAAAIRNAQDNGAGGPAGDDLGTPDNPLFLGDPEAVEGDTEANANDLLAPVKEEILTDDGSGGWYFPGGAPEPAKKPSTQAIKNMQAYFGVPQTGRWDAATRKATGMQSLVEAYNLWNEGKLQKQQGSWRREERSNGKAKEPEIVIDERLQGVSDEELERMIESGEVVMFPYGEQVIVKRVPTQGIKNAGLNTAK